MRNAPSVLIPVGRSRLGAWVPGLAWTAALILGVLWWWQAPDPSAWAGVSRAQGFMAVLLAVSGAWSWLAWHRSPRGLLDWNGERWCWTTAQGDCGVGVSVVCDLQACLLLRMLPADGSAGAQWVWITRGNGGAPHWLAVRRALYSPSALKASPEPPAVLPTVPP